MKSYNQWGVGAVARPDPGSGWSFAKWFSRPKPCPENITQQPHRKGLQTRWISAGTGWNVRPPERKAWGGGTCVWGANRRCCLQPPLFGVFGSLPQRNTGSGSLGLYLFPSFSKQPWGQWPSSLSSILSLVIPFVCPKKEQSRGVFWFFVF